MRELIISVNDSGQRLDKFLTKAVRGMPQSMMYKCIRTKKIKVNRHRAEPDMKLNAGDTVQLFVRDEFFAGPSDDKSAIFRIKPKLEIVYEDENLILVDKRPGVLVHEDTAGNENTLIMHILAYLAQKGEYDPDKEQSFTPALCNRIDRNTGGIVIAAKNAASLRELNALIKNGYTHKYYICAVHGVPTPKKGMLHGWLVKDSASNTVSVTDKKVKGSKECLTEYRVISEKNGEALLEVKLHTGRTHQIRAQFSHAGHPLLGDGKYGINREDKTRGYKYQALYAYRLGFTVKEGPLAYLDGREYSIPSEKIWFAKEFARGNNE